MPQSTYVPLATYTTTSTTEGTITISSIPDTYKHLVITAQCGRYDNVLTNIYMRFNNDSTSSYNAITMAFANGATGVYRNTLSSSYAFLYTNQETTFTRLDLMDYTSTVKFKTAMAMGGTPAINHSLNALTWRNTSAINRIDLFTAASGFTVGSKVTVWGII